MILLIWKYEKNTDEWKKDKNSSKDFWLLEDYYNSIKKFLSIKKIKTITAFDFSQLYVQSNKSIETQVVKKQDEFKPEKLDDKNPPIIKVDDKFTFKNSSYSIKGMVTDNSSGPIYIEVDGVLSETREGFLKLIGLALLMRK